MEAPTMNMLDRIIALPAGAVLLRLAGELDVATVPELEAAFVRASEVSADIVVDMREVTFMDAAAIGAFIRAQHSVAGRGGGLVLVGVQPWICKVLRVARVDGVLPRHPDLRAALSSLPGLAVGSEPAAHR
jgi:anti-anti-sigma factor